MLLYSQNAYKYKIWAWVTCVLSFQNMTGGKSGLPKNNQNCRTIEARRTPLDLQEGEDNGKRSGWVWPSTCSDSKSISILVTRCNMLQIIQYCWQFDPKYLGASYAEDACREHLPLSHINSTSTSESRQDPKEHRRSNPVYRNGNFRPVDLNFIKSIHFGIVDCAWGWARQYHCVGDLSKT